MRARLRLALARATKAHLRDGTDDVLKSVLVHPGEHLGAHRRGVDHAPCRPRSPLPRVWRPADRASCRVWRWPAVSGWRCAYAMITYYGSSRCWHQHRLQLRFRIQISEPAESLTLSHSLESRSPQAGSLALQCGTRWSAPWQLQCQCLGDCNDTGPTCARGASSLTSIQYNRTCSYEWIERTGGNVL